MKKKIPMAICYDFDGTLSPGNMQEYGFMTALKQRAATKFWGEAQKIAEEQSADDISAYMLLMLKKSHEAKIKSTRVAFNSYGEGIPLYKGVEDWFARINAYAGSKGVDLSHYIISSGLKEIIEGTKIAKEFKVIFASSFMYDENDVAFWPAVAFNTSSRLVIAFPIKKPHGSEAL